MEIFSPALALGNTLPEALRNAGELGVGLQVWLQQCRDTLMVTLGDVQFVPHATPNWKDFTLDSLRSRFLVDQYGHLIPCHRIPDGRHLARPMPLFELIRRWGVFPFHGSILLMAGEQDLIGDLDDELGRCGIGATPDDREGICFGTTNGQIAAVAMHAGLRTVFFTIPEWWHADPEAGWFSLKEMWSGHPKPLIGCPSTGYQGPVPWAVGKAKEWSMYVQMDQPIPATRADFRDLEEHGVAGVICPDPVLALMR